MNIKYLFLIAFSVCTLLVGCAGTRSLGEDTTEFKRFGQYRFHSEEFLGEGTIVFKADQSLSRCILYSPFGKRIFELKRFNNTLLVIDDEGVELTVDPQSPASIPSLLAPGTLTYGELFTILSGKIPAFLQESVDSCSSEDPIVLDRGVLFVEKRREKTRFVKFVAPLFKIELDGRFPLFRSILLKTGSTNYFQINYEN